MKWQNFHSDAIILKITYHNKKYQTLLYSPLFSTFYMTESGEFDIAYVEYVKTLSCVSEHSTSLCCY